jgi:2-dehydropantoate 2-reductase
LAHLDRLDAEFGVARVLGGCCHLNGVLTPEGVIKLLSELHGITFGLRAGNAVHARAVLEQLQSAFEQTPVRVQHSETVLQGVWEKYAFLAAFAAMTCLMRSSVGDIMATTGGKPFMLRLLAECEAAARHAGYPLRTSVIEHNKKILTDKSSLMTSSMLRDLESGGRTEGEHIVNDMRQRVLASGSDAILLTLAWTHLQTREARLARERKETTKKSL